MSHTKRSLDKDRRYANDKAKRNKEYMRKKWEEIDKDLLRQIEQNILIPNKGPTGQGGIGA